MTIKAEESDKLATATTTATEYGSIISQEEMEKLPIAEAVQVLGDETVQQKDDDDRNYRRTSYNNNGPGCDAGCVTSIATLICLVIMIGLLTLLFEPAVPDYATPSRSSSSSSPNPPPTPSNTLNANPVVIPPVPPPPTVEEATPLPTSPPTSPPKIFASLNLPREGPLMDLIHSMDDDSEHRTLSEIASVQRDVPGCEVQVLLVNDIEDGWLNPKAFTTALFNTWALGSRETNNGVLILFLLDPHRIEVEVGASLDQYMDQQWTTAMLKRRAVPEFKIGNYGFGIYNVVVSVADRLRDIENGIAVPYRETSQHTRSGSNGGGDDDVDPTVISLFLGGIATMISCVCCCNWYDSKYPMGQNKYCRQCGQCNWSHDRWEHITSPTYHSEGLKRRHCICNQCQATESVEHTIPVLSRNDDNNNNYSSSSTSSSGGGGGHSSGHGGGGASW